MFTKYCYGDQIKENDMGRAYSMHERDEISLQNFNWKPEREGTTRDIWA